MSVDLRELLKAWTLIEKAANWEKWKTDTSHIGYGKVKTLHDILFYKDYGDHVTIMCTGSNSFLEWMSNFCFWNKKGFHSGFYRTAERMYKKLSKRIDFNGKKVYLVGHSRGGGYGLPLCVIIAEENNCDYVRIDSFGSPEQCKKRGVVRAERAGVIHNRAYAGRDIVRIVGMSKHYGTPIPLPTVKGFDHLQYRRSIETAIAMKGHRK